MERWWVMSEDILRMVLERAHAGESPGLLLVELDANSETEVFGAEE
jgi:hypothetical protein